MIQQYGRTAHGRVRHIIRTRYLIPHGASGKTLCGIWAMVIPLYLTVGGTCERCISHPDFNRQNQSEGETV